MKVKAKDLVSASGIGASAISHEVKRGKLVRDENKNFDLTNSINKDWCNRHGINSKTIKSSVKVGAEAEKKKQSKKKIGEGQKKKPEIIIDNKDIITDSEFEDLSGLPARMAEMTMRQVVMRFGGPMQLKGYVDILDKIMAAQKKDVDIQEKRKELVPRKFIDFLKSYVDTYNNRLFDYADGCVSEIISIVVANKEKAKMKIPELLRKNFSKFAEETKRRIDKEIKNLKVENDTSD